MERIERVQYQAALAVTGTWKGTNRNKLYDELGWESLSDRRWCRQLILLFKIHNNLSPEYLKNSLPPLRRVNYGVNNPNLYGSVKVRTAKYMNSFFPSTIKSWNVIVRDIQPCL